MDAEAWAQVASAAFTALAAFAALYTVIRAERDRADRRLPDFDVEYLWDDGAQEARVHLANNGGPTRNVSILGEVDGEGFLGLVGPTTYWRPGESRVVQVAMRRPNPNAPVHVLVLGQDVRRTIVFTATHAGVSSARPIRRYRWQRRRQPGYSQAGEWRRNFPGVPDPVQLGLAHLHPYDVVDRQH